MKFQVALLTSALLGSIHASRWYSGIHRTREPQCQALQVPENGKCVCPAPLFEGPIKGDYNCYCGYQVFKSTIKEEVLAEPLPEGGYRCACYRNDHGEKTEWD